MSPSPSMLYCLPLPSSGRGKTSLIGWSRFFATVTMSGVKKTAQMS